jgi:protein-S-isoprenylcysteine O-methyltransferase Ste14
VYLNSLEEGFIMKNRMTEFGVGPRFTVYSALYFVFMYGLGIFIGPLSGITRATGMSSRIRVTAGAFLIVLGIPFYLFSLIPVLKAFKEGRLVSSGVYGACRHPVYAAWMLFFMPAIALFADSWPFMTAPGAMYLMAKPLVKREDEWLERTFGQEYVEYKKRVPAFMPYGWLNAGPRDASVGRG